MWLAPALSGVSHAEQRPYTMADNVRLSPQMRTRVAQLARRYHARTGQRLHVTSGTRSPRQQAEAMYDKLRLGVRLTRLYRDYEAASEITQAYRSHRRAGRSRCIGAIARVIRGQVRRGRFISRHLHASAVDIRSRNMNRRQRRIFREIVREAGDIELLEEGRPPHWHLQM